MRARRGARVLVGGLASSLVLAALGLATGPASPAVAASSAKVMKPVASGTSAAASSIATRAPAGGTKEREIRRLTPQLKRAAVDPATQDSSSGPVTPSAALNVKGLGIDDSIFQVHYAPPDTNAAVGKQYLVQAVNTQFAIYSKATGQRIGVPIFGSQLFDSMLGTAGEGCAKYDDGDPVVQYDKVRDRFVLTQFAYEQYPSPMLECVAVSRTGDPRGAYDVFAFAYPKDEFVDYPKFGVWPDGYYVTYNVFDFNSSAYLYGEMCALDLNAVSHRANRPVTQQCFQTGPEGGGMLPADLDGSLAPPADNADEYGVALLSNTTLGVWRHHTDWAHPDRSSNDLVGEVPVAQFDLACGGGACIPQPGTGQLLDSLSDRMMYRLAYRNLGTRQALVGTHSVTGLSSRRTTGSAVRWYEFAPQGSSLAVTQQGTYTPDNTSRWMPSIAMNKYGSIGVGYSASSSTSYPSIRWAAQLSTDDRNELRPESTIQLGGGSQKNNGYKLSRWGDYSSMTMDPVDDCTMWFTTEYLTTDGVFNWSTRIAKLKLPDCA